MSVSSTGTFGQPMSVSCPGTFGQPMCVSCPMYRNVKDQESSLGIGLKRMDISSVGSGVRLESGRSRVRIPLASGFFRGRVIPVTSKLALQWLPCQAPGVTGSALGLVGPVSVYCDWVR